jgi:hypothetical protein
MGYLPCTCQIHMLFMGICFLIVGFCWYLLIKFWYSVLFGGKCKPRSLVLVVACISYILAIILVAFLMLQ